ncbi:transcription factor TFIIIB complex subunit Brf1 [Aspergillus luchuensis IFO 4308]|nr:transcription factor TFIIIB complex subunit Brf1 [Aspergillus luchuensis IFO 4308]
MFTCQAAFALFGYNQAVFSGIINNADFLSIVHHPTTAIGATVQTSSYSKAQLLVSRLFTGIGIGIMTTTVPVYQAELCITIAYWYDYGMSYVDGPINWRLPIASQVIIAILVIILILGAIDDGRPEYKWSEIFKKDELHTGRRILLAYGLQFTNQMGGAPLIVTYVTTVLEDNVGLDAKLSLLLSGVIQLMFVIGAFYPIFYSDRLGRRSPMMWGSFGLFVCLLMISILLSFKGTNLEKSTATASVAFFFLYMLIYGATINCIPWVYGPELLPQQVRTKGQAIGISANWLWSFFVNMISPTLIRDLAWKGYLIFVAFNLAFIPIVYFYYPETANLSLEDIDSLFGVQKAQPIREDDKGFTWVETRPVS